MACEELINMMKKNGVNADITIYKDAHHSFDREDGLAVAKNGYKFSDCRFKLSDQGEILMNYINIPMSNPFLQKLDLRHALKEAQRMVDIKNQEKNPLNSLVISCKVFIKLNYSSSSQEIS